MDQRGYLKFSETSTDKGYYLDKEIVEEMTSHWPGTPLDVVLDVGCGPGRNSTYWLNNFFPNITRLIAFDIDPGMIALAKQKNAKENVEFHVADIMEKHTLKEWEGRADKIVSMFVLHRVRDQKTAFKNLFDLLKSSGDAALIFVMDGIYYDVITDLIQIPKWKSLLESTNFIFPEACIKKYDRDNYKKMFEDVGFVVDVCEKRSVYHGWESDDDCKNFLKCLHSIGPVSTQMQEDFDRDVFDLYEKHSTRDLKGQLHYNATVLYAELHKGTGSLKRQIAA